MVQREREGKRKKSLNFAYHYYVKRYKQLCTSSITLENDDALDLMQL